VSTVRGSSSNRDIIPVETGASIQMYKRPDQGPVELWGPEVSVVQDGHTAQAENSKTLHSDGRDGRNVEFQAAVDGYCKFSDGSTALPRLIEPKYHIIP
jgi:hypothetical protein